LNVATRWFTTFNENVKLSFDENLSLAGFSGAVITSGEHLSAWGEIELVRV
jgi:hypothetical protein